VRILKARHGSVNVAWMTDEASTTVVHYGRSTAYGKMRSSSSLVVRHGITVNRLSANTRYHYQVESEDEAGNLAVSADLTFKTAR